MHAILSSNQNSSLLQTLEQSPHTVAPFSYGLETIQPSVAREYQTISATTTPALGATFEYLVPRYGMWSQAVMKVVLTTPTAAAYEVHSKHGLYLFDTIQVVASGRRLYNQNNINLAQGLSTLPDGDKLRAERGLRIFNDNADAGFSLSTCQITIYVPILWSTFQEPSTRLDLSFVEPLRVRCTMPTGVDLLWHLATDNVQVAPTLTSCELVVCLEHPSNSLHTKTLKDNFSDQTPLIVVANDFSNEVDTAVTLSATARTTSAWLDITENGVVDLIYVSIHAHPVSDASNAHTMGLHKYRFLCLENIEFQVNGSTVLSLDGMMLDCFALAPSKGTYNPLSANNYNYAIPTSLLYAQVAGSNLSSGISLRELSNPRVRVTVNAIANATALANSSYMNYEVCSVAAVGALTPIFADSSQTVGHLMVGYRKQQSLAIDPSSGSITIGSST